MNMIEKKVMTILLVEDNAGDVEMFLRAVEEDLPRSEHEEIEMVFAARAEGGLKILQERHIDLVIIDIRLPGMNGIELLQRIQQMDRRIPVIFVSWVDSVDTVVEAVRHGAIDYIVKPFERLDLVVRIHRAMRMADFLSKVRVTSPTLPKKPFTTILGSSLAIQEVMKMIETIASVNSTALILGATGTGKELIARAIHDRSAEGSEQFQIVDCTSLSEGTIESELFGHVRGAFTGAVSDKQGLLDSGRKGTVFFDEIGDLPLGLQAKLLRVLEEGEVRAVGSTKQKKINVRFLAATNQDLAEKVKQGEFRKDLFFRLNVMVIRVPSLAERTEDIPILSRHFISRFSTEFGKAVDDIEPAALPDLMAYPWPGNIRELRNVIERAVMLAKGDRISRSEVQSLLLVDDTGEERKDNYYLGLPYSKAKEKVLEEFNQRYINSKLAAHGGNVTHAANEAGLPRSYFHEIMRRYLKDGKS